MVTDHPRRKTLCVVQAVKWTLWRFTLQVVRRTPSVQYIGERPNAIGGRETVRLTSWHLNTDRYERDRRCQGTLCDWSRHKAAWRCARQAGQCHILLLANAMFSCRALLIFQDKQRGRISLRRLWHVGSALVSMCLPPVPDCTACVGAGSHFPRFGQVLCSTCGGLLRRQSGAA